jgi:hypothetical protein
VEDDERGCPRSHIADENADKVWNLLRLSSNQVYYTEIMTWLCKAVSRKRSELQPNDWILHHDNAPAQKALSVKQFIEKKMKCNTHPIPLIWPRLTLVGSNNSLP